MNRGRLLWIVGGGREAPAPSKLPPGTQTAEDLWVFLGNQSFRYAFQAHSSQLCRLGEFAESLMWAGSLSYPRPVCAVVFQGDGQTCRGTQSHQLPFGLLTTAGCPVAWYWHGSRVRKAPPVFWLQASLRWAQLVGWM